MSESMEESGRWARVARERDMEGERKMRAQLNERIAQLEDALAAERGAESMVNDAARVYGSALEGLQVDDPALRARLEEQRRQFSSTSGALQDAFERARETLRKQADELEEELAGQTSPSTAEQENDDNGGDS